MPLTAWPGDLVGTASIQRCSTTLFLVRSLDFIFFRGVREEALTTLLLVVLSSNGFRSCFVYEAISAWGR